MACVKCGRETGDYFCAHCLEEMEKRPLKNRTVLLSRRERDAYYARKRYSRPVVIASDEQLAKSRKKLRRLRVLTGLLVLLLIGVCGLGWYEYNQLNALPKGQNYSVNSSKEQPAKENVSRETPGS